MACSTNTPSSADYLAQALELARRGEGHTRPNPPVGAVIVRDGVVIGKGYHRRCGTDHAEVAAIKSARVPVTGATIYVTLEPCSKPGRVGACTDAIVRAGISRVVYACEDPNPANRGRAKKVLAAHGVACERYRFAKDEKKLKEDLDYLIAPFSKFIRTGLPYVTVKLAMSLDGRICDDRGDAKWITSEAMRRRTGRLRERVDAIVVGAQTVRADNPSLLSHGRRNDDLIRVVVSGSGRLPRQSQIFTDGRNTTIVFRSIDEMLEELGRRGVLHVLCEGGKALAGSLAERGLVDEWMLAIAPKVIASRPIADAAVIPRWDVLMDR